jgi:hypothetical protein
MTLNCSKTISRPSPAAINRPRSMLIVHLSHSKTNKGPVTARRSPGNPLTPPPLSFFNTSPLIINVQTFRHSNSLP